MSTAIIGDLHASGDKPKSRKDDYPNVCIDKLERVLKLHDYVIVLGDFFNTSSVSTEYCNNLVKRLKPYKGRIHSILGNHDASYRTLNIDRTDMGLLFNTDILTLHLDTFELEGTFYDVASVVPELKLPKKKSDILLGHFYLDDNRSQKESLSVKELSKYKYVFLGHEHSPKDVIVTETTNIYRMGSFTRNDASEYHLTRDHIVYAVVDKGIIKLDRLEIAKPEDVFHPEVFTKNSRVYDTSLDLSNLDTLIANFKKRNPAESIGTKKILLELGAPESRLEYLKSVHEFLGIKF